MGNNIFLGIDPGNHEIKMIGAKGALKFYSDIGEARELRLKQNHGPDDMIFEYEGRKGFAGTLARNESEFCGSMMGDTKAHEDAKLRILLALHRYCDNYSNIYLVTGQPIKGHTDKEKIKIKKMLEGPHEITINNVTKHFFIINVEVAPEGAAAYWSEPQKQLTRILDIGGGTVNAATVNEARRYVDKGSFTLDFGANTNFSNDLKAMARGITSELSKKWSKTDLVLIAGGIADDIEPHIKDYFVNARAIDPIFNNEHLHPVFANSVGFYKLAVAKHGKR